MAYKRKMKELSINKMAQQNPKFTWNNPYEQLCL